MERTIDDLVETVGASKARGRGSTLLIGAGCSVTAGVPTAAGFVDLIKDRFPSAFSRAEGETYAKCMAQLSPGERQELIGEFVSEARLNWAHIAIAQLMKSGFVGSSPDNQFRSTRCSCVRAVRTLPGNLRLRRFSTVQASPNTRQLCLLSSWPIDRIRSDEYGR